MRILFVAMSNSVHTARWISQIADQGWDIHLFPSYEVSATHNALHNVTVHHHTARKPRLFRAHVEFLRTKIAAKAIQKRRAKQLARLIDDLKPGIVHSLEFQGAGYLTFQARAHVKNPFPTWIVTSWGSDIYYFGRFPYHATKIKHILEHANYFWSECKRDIDLAKKYGFKHHILPILPAAGGVNLDQVNTFKSDIPPAKRTLIMLKGYQGWAGRANRGLQALKQCRDAIGEFEIVMYSTELKSRIAARSFTRATKIPITIIPHGTDHHEILKLHGRARTSIGLSITDGVPNGMLEAMALASLPIQSWTSAADEWIKDGKNGLLVPPSDPDAIEKAIRRALSDDAFVNHAATLNYDIIKHRLDARVIKPQVIDLYQQIYKKNHQ